MNDSRPRSDEPLLIITTLLLALAFTANVLHLSAYGGRLAFPPAPDDVVYLLSGFDLFEASLKQPAAFLLRELPHDHAPFQSLLAFVGYRLFGVNQQSAYQINGILLMVFMLGVLWMSRPLGAVFRLSIALIVLATPLAANLVAEFRPDLFWGLLCGFAVFLLMHPKLFDHDRGIRIGALFLSVTALHAKPSASPATALLLASALAIAVGLRSIYRPLRPSEVALRLLVPLAIGLLVSAPFFVLNARYLYDYMITAFVTWRDVNQFRGSPLDHATFYSVGMCYRTGLFMTLWIGLSAFFVQACWLRIRRLNRDLAHHCALVSVVVLAYAIPSFSGVKSYYLGGIFYGTFLVATIGTIVELFRSFEHDQNCPGYYVSWVLPVLAVLTVLTAPAVPFAHLWDPRLAEDRNDAYRQMVSAIVKDASQRHRTDPVVDGAATGQPQRPVSIYTASPAVMTAHSISLLARWQGTPAVANGGYYTRTIQALQHEATQSDYVVLSDFHDSLYPGSILSPQLLELIKNDPDFKAISTFQHTDGSWTYLFWNRRAKTGSQN